MEEGQYANLINNNYHHLGGKEMWVYIAVVHLDGMAYELLSTKGCGCVVIVFQLHPCSYKLFMSFSRVVKSDFRKGKLRR